MFVSVIIPVYNTLPDYFRVCMESVLNQTFKDFEVILVDDGSSNGVEALCDEYSDSDERVRVIHQKNSGVSAARNTGTDHARGEWIIFLDPDDWWEADTLQQLYAYKGQDGLNVILFSYFDNFDDQNRQFKRSFYREKAPVFQELSKDMIRNIQIGILDESIRKTNFTGACWMHMARREFLEEKQLRFDPGLQVMEDIVYDLELLEYARAGVLNVSLYHYRHHGASVCNRCNNDIADLLEAGDQAIYKFFQSHGRPAQDSFRFFLMYNYLKILRLNFFNQNNPKSWRTRKKEWKLWRSRCWSCQELKQADVGMIMNKRKIFGVLFYFTFCLPSFEVMYLLFKIYFQVKKQR